ncbi:MAG TPA: hypothetical protein VHB79_24085 [Polyangiaceae bacterium]|nr:hypothetical protein [Polyangiaceae bacterium]
MSHETVASQLATAYLKGDADERVRIAQECEEQGIVAVLVAARLRRDGLEDEFVSAMKRSVEEGRGR